PAAQRPQAASATADTAASSPPVCGRKRDDCCAREARPPSARLPQTTAQCNACQQRPPNHEPPARHPDPHLHPPPQKVPPQAPVKRLSQHSHHPTRQTGSCAPLGLVHVILQQEIRHAALQ